MRDFVMRQAESEEDVNSVVTIWNEASEWLATRGTDQWQYPVRVDAIRRKVAEGVVWLAEDSDGDALATVTLDEDADARLWGAEDRPAAALYLHRLAIRSSLQGMHLGTAIIDWARGMAHAMGKEYLRLDAWTSNTRLHQYYLSQGFRHVRTVDGDGIISGVLFECPASGRVLPEG